MNEVEKYNLIISLPKNIKFNAKKVLLLHFHALEYIPMHIERLNNVHVDHFV